MPGFFSLLGSNLANRPPLRRGRAGSPPAATDNSREPSDCPSNGQGYLVDGGGGDLRSALRADPRSSRRSAGGSSRTLSLLGSNLANRPRLRRGRAGSPPAATDSSREPWDGPSNGQGYLVGGGGRDLRSALRADPRSSRRLTERSSRTVPLLGSNLAMRPRALPESARVRLPPLQKRSQTQKALTT